MPWLIEVDNVWLVTLMLCSKLKKKRSLNSFLYFVTKISESNAQIDFPSDLPLKLQSMTRFLRPRQRPTRDVIDNERCSGSSERKIPRALAT